MMVSSSGSSLRCDSIKASSSWRDVFLEIDRLVLRRSGKFVQALPHFLGIKVQSLRDHVGVDRKIASGIAQQQSGKGRIVVHNYAAIAVENLAARRQNWNFASLVLLRQRRIELALTPPAAATARKPAPEKCRG